MSVAALVAAGALLCSGPSTAQSHAQQLVTVRAHPGATIASLELWQRRGACFRRVAGPWTARLGGSGLSSHKREGDGATPTGTYPFGTTVYGIARNPGVKFAYHRLVCGDWWDEDSSSPTYNTFRHVTCGATPPFGGDSEALWRVLPQYRYFALIEYNAHPAVPGRGSAIFLHVSAAHATAGCVSLPEAQLVRLLRWLRPAARPMISIRTG
jgi:L,D-peptidoglycan transpeptidase YkuD (ErfK/YbiS/YcfS/YnhG family)